MYRTGNGFDAKHLDNFVKSDTHERFKNTVIIGKHKKASSNIVQSIQNIEAAEEVNSLIASKPEPMKLNSDLVTKSNASSIVRKLEVKGVTQVRSPSGNKYYEALNNEYSKKFKKNNFMTSEGKK